MSWLLVAFTGPVLWAISVHLDKYLVERYFKEGSVAALLVFTSLVGVVMLPFILYYVPSTAALPPQSIAVIGFTGILNMAAMYFYLAALQSNEASVVAPFYQAAPLFAYGLAYAILGEVLSVGQLVGGALIVAGTALMSIDSGGAKARINLRLVALMLACALSLAISSVVFKLFALRDDFWPTTFWTYAGEALFGAGVLAIPEQRKIFVALLRVRAGAVLAINGANELINLSASLIVRYAMLLAPLSLVQAVASTTTVFVFLFGIVLSVAWPGVAREDLSRPNLVKKAIAIGLVAVGIARLGAV